MAEPTPENLLTVTAYGATNRARQIIDAIALLDEMHGARRMLTSGNAFGIGQADMRCRTCYLPDGFPTPWPCDTFVRFSALFDLPMNADTIALFRSLGIRTNRAPGESVAQARRRLRAIEAPNTTRGRPIR